MNRTIELIKMEVKDEVIHLEFNRPDRLNALNVEMIDCFVERLEEVIHMKQKVIILSGVGTAFSSGGDIQAMSSSISDVLFQEIMGKVKEMILKVYTLPKIVISAVHGPAAGLGFSLALASDYIVASNDAKFGLNFIHIGLVADGGCHFLLKNRIGYQNTKHAIWKGKTFHAKEAYDLGIIDFLVDDHPYDQATELVSSTLQMSFEAQIESKLILNATEVLELTKVLDLECDAQCRMRKSDEHIHRIQAFLKKSKKG
ncbi:enoyl-CoA hydratase-related protein [Pseudalkalibacillus berkeleyi]|uniref:Enoyl-CoA hydratase-related protein n=1 Tax=Pseudalkalibacillus berkeleyi TaxID=1069813 RepID=A0ABS9H3R9_9BACL|nr:enoyl-CoA hydratase-related protein [Pseudalkalibacillus berkeleyi]MCF6138455.1 enoyl-CoA hydratase-related protein [Pseudalkalibacillus berkeleyi]